MVFQLWICKCRIKKTFPAVKGLFMLQISQYLPCFFRRQILVNGDRALKQLQFLRCRKEESRENVKENGMESGIKSNIESGYRICPAEEEIPENCVRTILSAGQLVYLYASNGDNYAHASLF